MIRRAAVALALIMATVAPVAASAGFSYRVGDPSGYVTALPASEWSAWQIQYSIDDDSYSSACAPGVSPCEVPASLPDGSHVLRYRVAYDVTTTTTVDDVTTETTETRYAVQSPARFYVRAGAFGLAPIHDPSSVREIAGFTLAAGVLFAIGAFLRFLMNRD